MNVRFVEGTSGRFSWSMFSDTVANLQVGDEGRQSELGSLRLRRLSEECDDLSSLFRGRGVWCHVAQGSRYVRNQRLAVAQ